jgi:hypothetical protein
MSCRAGLIKDQEACELFALMKLFKNSAVVRILESTCNPEEKAAFSNRFGVRALEYLSRNNEVDRPALQSAETAPISPVPVIEALAQTWECEIDVFVQDEVAASASASSSVLQQIPLPFRVHRQEGGGKKKRKKKGNAATAQEEQQDLESEVQDDSNSTPSYKLLWTPSGFRAILKSKSKVVFRQNIHDTDVYLVDNPMSHMPSQTNKTRNRDLPTIPANPTPAQVELINGHQLRKKRAASRSSSPNRSAPGTKRPRARAGSGSRFMDGGGGGAAGGGAQRHRSQQQRTQHDQSRKRPAAGGGARGAGKRRS